MKAILKSLVFLLFLSNLLPAQTIYTAKGWQILGAKVDITDFSKFSGTIFAYQNNNWLRYDSSNKSSATLSSISSGEGFWFNATDSSTVVLNGTDIATNSINVKSGWQLKAAINDICSAQLFNNDNIISVYSYNGSNWKLYNPKQTNSSQALLSYIRSGEGFWINSTSSTTLTPTLTITGAITDGYVKDARLEIASLNSNQTVSILSSSTSNSISNNNGAFRITIENPDSNGYVISSSSGTDEATGEDYEGVLKSVISTDECKADITIKQNITPITTLVAQSVLTIQSSTKKARSKSAISKLISDTEKRVADTLGINKAYINSDPQALLRTSKNENTKKASTKLMKASLNVQKTAEIMASSVVKKENKEEYNKVVSAGFKAIATSISKSNNTNDFETLIADTDTLITDTTTNINTIASTNITKAKEKLTASKSIIKNSTEIILEINEDEIITDSNSDVQLQIEAVQKSTEIVTRKIEQKAQDIATATEADITTKAKGVNDILKSVAISGGVEGTKALIKDKIKTLAKENKSIDASTYADKLFSDTIIATKKKSYEQVFEDKLDNGVFNAALKSYETIIQTEQKGETVNAQFVEQTIGANIVNLVNKDVIEANVREFSTVIASDIKAFFLEGQNFIAQAEQINLFTTPVDPSQTKAIDNFSSITQFSSSLLANKTYYLVSIEDNEQSSLYGLWFNNKLKFSNDKYFYQSIDEPTHLGEDSYKIENSNLITTSRANISKEIKIIEQIQDYLKVTIANQTTKISTTGYMFASLELANTFKDTKNQDLTQTALATLSDISKLEKDTFKNREFYEVYFKTDEPNSAYNFRWNINKVRFTNSNIIYKDLLGSENTIVKKYTIANAVLSSTGIGNNTSSTKTILKETKTDYLLLEHTDTINNKKSTSRLYLSQAKALVYASSQNQDVITKTQTTLNDITGFNSQLEDRRLFFISNVALDKYTLNDNFFLNSQTKLTSDNQVYQIQTDGTLFIEGLGYLSVKETTTDVVSLIKSDSSSFRAFIYVDRVKAEDKLLELNSQPVSTDNNTQTTSSTTITDGTYSGTFVDSVCNTSGTSNPLIITVSQSKMTFKATSNYLLINGTGNQQESSIKLLTNNGAEFASGIFDTKGGQYTGTWRANNADTGQVCQGRFSVELK